MNDVNKDDTLDTSGQWNEINLEDLEEEIEEDEEELLEEEDTEEVEEEEEEEEDDDNEIEHSEADDEETEDEQSEEETSEQEESKEDSEVERKRSAQARIRELANQKREAQEEADALRREAEALKKQLRESTKQQSSAHKSNLNSQLAQAEDELKRAFTEGDPEAFAEAQLKAQKLQVKLMAMDAYEADFEEGEPEEEKPQAQRTPSRDEVISMLPESGQDWAMDNDWFMSNRILTEAAFQISAQLEAEGIDPSDPVHFDELDAEMAKRFPRKFGKKSEVTEKEVKKKPKGTPKMGSSNNKPPTKRKKAIKLTPEQRNMAITMGVSEKAYAQQLARQEAADGRGWIELG